MTDTTLREPVLIPASEYARVSSSAACTTLKLHTIRDLHYQIYNVKRPLVDDPAILGEVLGAREVVLIVEKTLIDRFGERLMQCFYEQTKVARVLALPAQEADKTWDAVRDICEAAVMSGVRRDGVFVGVGGGVLLDLVGVAASLYRRGIRYVRVPTTLVGAVDVAVGIKTAFNFAGKKNTLGTFFPPLAAVVDRSFLASLDRRFIACGVAEIIKMGLVCDARLFELLETWHEQLMATRFQEPPEIAAEIIVRAQASMMDQLEPNIYEDDLRRLVDFGHTISPTLEAASDYTISHGEAVAIDMAISCAIAVLRGFIQLSDLHRILRLYRNIGLPRAHGLCTTGLILKSFRDARLHRASALNAVVPVRIGAGTFLQDISEAELHDALRIVAREALVNA